jgi:hypothetical protein
MLIVHPHLHPRRSGVTAHVELIASAQASMGEVKVLGQQLPESLPKPPERDVAAARDGAEAAVDDEARQHGDGRQRQRPAEALQPGVALRDEGAGG